MQQPEAEEPLEGPTSSLERGKDLTPEDLLRVHT